MYVYSVTHAEYIVTESVHNKLTYQTPIKSDHNKIYNLSIYMFNLCTWVMQRYDANGQLQ